MELWIVIDSLCNEPEVFKTRDEAVSAALETLQAYQEHWRFEQEDYEAACTEMKGGEEDSDCWGTYLGECEVNIFKKFL